MNRRNPDQLFTIQKAARLLNVGPRSLFRHLREQHILDDQNLPYRRYCSAGYFKVRTTYFSTPIGDRARGRALVTVRGLQWLERQLQEGAA